MALEYFFHYSLQLGPPFQLAWSQLKFGAREFERVQWSRIKLFEKN